LKGKPWIRGAVTLAIIGGLAAALIATPALSLTSKDKKQVKKIANKQANQVFDSKIGSATVANAGNAANADKLDNLDSADFQKEADLLFAVVDNAGSTATVALVRGRGATGVGAFFATTVTFNRNVDTCSYVASAQDTPGDDQAFATARLGSSNNDVVVALFDDTGTIEVGETFHLQVICP
jgi:hypothetical protein